MLMAYKKNIAFKVCITLQVESITDLKTNYATKNPRDNSFVSYFGYIKFIFTKKMEIGC